MSTPATDESRVNQRDLRHRSKEIMDAVEAGDSYAVTRDGRVIGHLVPTAGPRRFVSRAELRHVFETATPVDLERFRADQSAVDDAVADAYAR